MFLMNIFVHGINHTSAPVAIREKLALSADEQREALTSLSLAAGVQECAIISTCNRTEVYVITGDGFNADDIERVLCRIKGAEPGYMKKYFYSYIGRRAVEHILYVAAGLDSVVFGEDQILGQIKTAQKRAYEAQCTKSVLNTLLRTAVTAAKRVKSDTAMSQNSLSIGALSVKLIRSRLDKPVDELTALVIGAGEIGTLCARHLKAAGVGRLIITSRSSGHAPDGAERVMYADRYSVMDACDAIISATSSPHYTITGSQLEESLVTQKRRVFIDLAVPGDIDRNIESESRLLFSIDDLDKAIVQNKALRMRQTVRARDIIGEEIQRFLRWMSMREAVGLIDEIFGEVGEQIDSRISRRIPSIMNAKDAVEAKSIIISAIRPLLKDIVYHVGDICEPEQVKSYYESLMTAVDPEERLKCRRYM